MSIENPMDVQIGGGHYKSMAIQPMEYSMANKLDACQHTAIKYITRFREKGGIQDLEKAKHVIDMLIHFEQRGAEVDIGVAAADAGQMNPLAEVVAAYAPIDPADVDISGEIPPDQWQKGDVVVALHNCDGQFSRLKRYTLRSENQRNIVSVVADDRGEENGWGVRNFRFHSRPTK